MSISAERRASKRIHFVQEVEVVGVGMRRCSDLSIGGMYLETVVGFPAGSLLRLRFKLRGAEEPLLEIQARVLYAHENVGVGLAFVDLPPEDREKLRKFVDQG
ncbi:MAG: PilZ domain-containing protein [Nitrospirae bacterium]|nr:PilZ domain-containing protein [Nitrospirota bacterium]